jgi:AcrR family transcriptional regulator
MDPRIARTHAAVMTAATELLAEGGAEAMTIDAVVARSGVAKSTLYRHWATRDDLVADVFNSNAPHLSPPDPDLDFEAALRSLMAELADTLADERWQRLLPALLALRAQHNGVAVLDSELKAQQHAVFSDLLRRGVDEGRVPPSMLDDLDRTITLIAGPLLMASLLDTAPLDRPLADACVDQFLAAHRAQG